MNSSDQQEKWLGEKMGLYVHVPFCSTACDFCAFYQEAADRKGIEQYLDGIEQEIALLGQGRPVDTFFWGGGTPGLLPATDLTRLGKALTSAFGQPLEEWTVEIAPSSVKADKLQALKELGVTRISIGAQSFDDTLLEALGRQHSRKQVLKACSMIREAGFESVNIDLIFAIPGQSEAQWRADLREAFSQEPDHLSTYCLTFEEDTALYIKLARGELSIDPEREAAFFEIAWEEAARAGFEQYEISNYAKPGERCAHNCNTWCMHEWIGLGPSAASQEGGHRYSNPADLRLWLKDLFSGKRGTSQRTALSKELLFEDSLIFGLRMNDGVDLALLENRFGLGLPEGLGGIIEQLADEGKLHRETTRIRLSPQGRLLADAVGEKLLGILYCSP